MPPVLPTEEGRKVRVTIATSVGVALMLYSTMRRVENLYSDLGMRVKMRCRFGKGSSDKVLAPWRAGHPRKTWGRNESGTSANSS